MCGILIAYSKSARLDVNACENASKKIFSRGPDYNFSSFKLDGRMYLSQTVLSITGNPALNLNYTKSKSERYEILFNGEIYNFRDLQKSILDPKGLTNTSNSDTETLVNLHDVQTASEIFNEIKGMYCYVIFDSKTENILIGRDTIGEKVLYKYEDDFQFIISSQIAPILELVKNIKIDTGALKEYFFTRHLLTNHRTVYKNLTTFSPGTLAIFKTQNFSMEILESNRPRDLVDIEKINNNKKRSSQYIYEDLENTFSSVARYIAPEIPYYSVVSGGIDSSLVSKYLNTFASNKPNLICLQFPNKDAVASEISQFNSFFNTKIKTKIVSEKLFEIFSDECYGSICMPLPTHSFISQAILAREIRSLGSKVLITGDGGDELFGGYEFYKSLSKYTEIPLNNPSIYSGVLDTRVKFNNWSNERLKEENLKLWNETITIYRDLSPAEATIQSILLLDSSIQLESVGIRASDTMSMMSSVESRGFFLTADMISFALNTPAEHKINLDSQDTNLVTRPLMKDLFIKKFGPDLLKPKQGFSGYPNEAIRKLVGQDFKLTKQYLEITNIDDLEIQEDIALEWKLLNCEYFLNKFNRYI